MRVKALFAGVTYIRKSLFNHYAKKVIKSSYPLEEFFKGAGFAAKFTPFYGGVEDAIEGNAAGDSLGLYTILSDDAALFDAAFIMDSTFRISQGDSGQISSHKDLNLSHLVSDTQPSKTRQFIW